MTRQERFDALIKYFSVAMPEPKTELEYGGDPFKLLVAVILSAQCTDKRVNMITPALFEAFPTPQCLAAASEDQVYE
ncbi:MAG: endonuclease III, partial [Muribaculaceae bacterium]|nr:endonuclease III [Muribaculaceae bacterium]